MLGMALDPNFPATPDVYVLYTYDAAIGGIAAHVGRQTARRRPGRPRRLCGERAAVAPDRVRERDDRLRAGADQRLVPAVPEPLDRQPRIRPRRSALRDRRRRRELQLRRLRPEPRDARAAIHPARAARSAARTCARRADPRRSTAPCCGSTRRHGPGPARQPVRRQLRRQRAPDRRLRAAQPVPGDVPARAPASCGSATSAGTHGRRSTALPTPTSATNFGWPCYEGGSRPTTPSPRQSGYDNANLSLCESLYAAGQSAVAAPWYTYNHGDRRGRAATAA